MRKFIFLFSVLLCSTFMFAKDYKDYGRLQVIHNQLCDENGTPIQLRGIVLPNLNALPYMCDGKIDVTNMKDLGANVVNITMDIANLNINKVTNILDWCYEKDMYAIVNLSFGSYHGDCFSTYKLSWAKDYFTKMAEYCVPKNYKNVMYNICSDVEGNTWDEIKSYASTIIYLLLRKNTLDQLSWFARQTP